MERTCENCKKNITYMPNRTECLMCANGESDAFEPIPVKTPRWDEQQQAYICQHCGSVVSTTNMAWGFKCRKCRLPIHEK